MDDVGLIEPVLDLTGLGLGDGLGDIRGDGAGLGVGHQAAGAEHLTETADHTHHIGAGDDDVEIHPAALNFGDELLSAHKIGARVGSGLLLVALGKHQHPDLFAGAVRQHDGAADLLVGMTGIDAQADMDFHSLIEFCFAGFYREIERLRHLIEGGTVDQFGVIGIFFPMFHRLILPVGPSREAKVEW